VASVAPQAVGDVDRPAILRPGFLDPIGRWPCRLTPYKRMQRCGAKIVAIGPDSDSCSAANGSLNNHPPQRVRAARDGDVERLSLMDQLALRLSSPSLKDSRPVRPTPSAAAPLGELRGWNYDIMASPLDGEIGGTTSLPGPQPRRGHCDQFFPRTPLFSII
jgi:hypothetical protein